MRKRLIAIALMTCFAPAIAQQPSDAQSAAVQAAIGAYKPMSRLKQLAACSV